jgi:hypothetical protein
MPSSTAAGIVAGVSVAPALVAGWTADRWIGAAAGLAAWILIATMQFGRVEPSAIGDRKPFWEVDLLLLQGCLFTMVVSLFVSGAQRWPQDGAALLVVCGGAAYNAEATFRLMRTASVRFGRHDRRRRGMFVYALIACTTVAGIMVPPLTAWPRQGYFMAAGLAVIATVSGIFLAAHLYRSSQDGGPSRIRRSR